MNLIHGGLRETHDRRVSKTIKDTTERGHAVEGLGLHELFEELAVEQCPNHILQHCLLFKYFSFDVWDEEETRIKK